MDNIYKAPSAELQDEGNGFSTFHFPVSMKKLWVMTLITFGVYGVVWNYYHWRHIKYRDETEADIWPVPRAIFSIFFIKSLFNWFDQSCKRVDLDYKWNSTLIAALYIISSIVSNLIDSVAVNLGGEALLLTSVLCVITITYSMAEGQKVANLANNDPSGSKNSRFTIANILWMIVGGLFWLMVAVGYLLPEGV